MVILTLMYIGIFYVSNFEWKADQLFQEPELTTYLSVTDNQVSEDQIIIGVAHNGQSKAYPLDIIAYHHNILDSVGHQPVLVTYCVWTRTGRVFDPVIEGQLATFDLIGLGGFNAIIKDKVSNSWWQQATGEAIIGKQKGAAMKQVYSEQMSLDAWIRKYPNTKILQPDSSFVEEYEHNGKFVARFCEEDNGQALDPWKERSWIIGVEHASYSAAFDFLYLREHHIIQDSVGGLPVLVILEADDIHHHVWDRRINGQILSFDYDQDSNELIEVLTGSTWNMNGQCISGLYEGEQLKPIQSSEEYWYAWEHFHPNSRKIYDYSTE